MYLKIKQGLFKHDLTDHYAILGIPIDANATEIRKRYLKIARDLHPDTYISQSEGGTDKQKEASEILAKLVNPAYKELYNSNSRKENQLLLSETARRLVAQKAQFSQESEALQKLAKAGPRLDAIYRKLVETLAQQEYTSLESTLKVIGEISELNKLYLILKEQGGQEIEWKKPEPVIAPKVDKKVDKTEEQTRIQVAEEEAKESEKHSEVVTRESALEGHIRRAKEHLDKNNIKQAKFELREAKILEPNSSSVQALIGLAYLKENQTAVAKIHLKKAKELNYHDPIVREVYQEYKKMRGGSDTTMTSTNSNSKKKSSDKADKTTLFGIKLPFFGKKK